MKLTIHREKGRQTFSFTAPQTLSELLRQAGVALPLPCGGQRRCGNCRVAAFGALRPPTAEEERLLGMPALLEGVRLACCAVAEGDCSVWVDPPREVSVQTAGKLRTAGVGPSLFGPEGYALAVDIGTTTVAAYLVDLSRPVAEPPAASAPNAQAPWGADVITRAGACREGEAGPLQRALLEQLEGLFRELLAREGVPMAQIRGILLSGNTVMLHLAAGLDPTPLTAAPYQPESLFGVQYAARELFFGLPGELPVYLAPCISGFVGADLVCAALACNLQPGELLLDAGTNGEMLLRTQEGDVCCSTATGPAFEGAGLRCGMVAAAGAIYDVRAKDGKLLCRTMGGGPARGICGTGAVSALAALLELGLVDETGLLAEECGGQVELAPKVVLTQEDIRQLQLAKGAVAAGMGALLEVCGLSAGQVSHLYIAGGFGSWIDPWAAQRIGMLPAGLAGRVEPVGNAAGLGACLMARSQSMVDLAQRMADRARTVELDTQADFQDRFVEALLFPTVGF